MVYMEQESYKQHKNCNKQTSEWDTLAEYNNDVAEKNEADLKSMQNNYRSHLETENDEWALKIEFNRFYEALTSKYPDVFPANRLNEYEIENELKDVISPYKQKILADEKLDNIIKKCFTDEDWYDGYLELTEFLSAKLYGGEKGSAIYFSNEIHVGDGYLEQCIYDNSPDNLTEFNAIVLPIEKSKYDTMHVHDPDYVSVTKRPRRDHFSDVNVILHEMWHVKQKSDVRNEPKDGRWKLYQINDDFYIHPKEVPVVGLSRFAPDFRPPHQYEQQLVEREANFFANSLQKDIVKKMKDKDII